MKGQRPLNQRSHSLYGHQSKLEESGNFYSASSQSFLPEPSRHDSDISKSTGIDSVHSDSTGKNSASSKSTSFEVELDKRPTRRNRLHIAHHIQRLRSKLAQGRLDLRERRAGVREQRWKVTDRGVKFYGELQRYSNKRGKVTDYDLEKLDEGLREALDKLGPMEEDYDEAEDDLRELEYRLETQEKKFYSQSVNLISVEDSTSSIRSSWSERTQHQSLNNTVSDAVEEASPSGRYLSRLGDAMIIRERLQDLVVERNEYFEQEQRRSSHSLPPYSLNVAFMANFPLVYTQLMKELQEIEEDVRQLKDQAGIKSENGEIAPTMPSSTESISHDQRAFLSTGHQSEQRVERREDVRYAVSEVYPSHITFNTSSLSTYPFTPRPTPSFRRISQGYVNEKTEEQAKKLEEAYTAQVPDEDVKENANSGSEQLQPYVSSDILRDSAPLGSMCFSSSTHTSILVQSDTQPAHQNGAADKGIPLTALELISQWILDQLRGSKLEQGIYKALQDDFVLDDKQWLNRVERFWLHDEAGGTLRPSQENSPSSISQHLADIDAPLCTSLKEQGQALYAKESRRTSVYPTTSYRPTSCGLILVSSTEYGRASISV